MFHRRARHARFLGRARKKRRWASAAARRYRCSSKTRRYQKRTCCTRLAAGTSSRSTHSTWAGSRWAPIAWAAQKCLETASKYSKERTAFGKRLCDFGLIQAKLGEMAIRIYAVESMIYRSAGMIEAAVANPSATGDKTQQAMQVLEEYAIESSISKVAGSETLDFCVDESVQIFGGYGFHEDYPVARAYRDSRINRIFEGTNEINRMLIIQMLMKRAMTGVLPLIPAAMKLGGEVLAGPSFEETPSGPFAEEERSLAAGEENISAGGGHCGAEVPGAVGGSTGSGRCAVQHRDGRVRHGIVPAPSAEGFDIRWPNGERNGRCCASFHPRRHGSHREIGAHGALRCGGRRDPDDATLCVAAICEACATQYDCGPAAHRRVPCFRKTAIRLKDIDLLKSGFG